MKIKYIYKMLLYVVERMKSNGRKKERYNYYVFRFDEAMNWKEYKKFFFLRLLSVHLMKRIIKCFVWS
jgi:hypothetical protein